MVFGGLELFINLAIIIFYNQTFLDMRKDQETVFYFVCTNYFLITCILFFYIWLTRKTMHVEFTDDECKRITFTEWAIRVLLAVFVVFFYYAIQEITINNILLVALGFKFFYMGCCAIILVSVVVQLVVDKFTRIYCLFVKLLLVKLFLPPGDPGGDIFASSISKILIWTNIIKYSMIQLFIRSHDA